MATSFALLHSNMPQYEGYRLAADLSVESKMVSRIWFNYSKSSGACTASGFRVLLEARHPPAVTSWRKGLGKENIISLYIFEETAVQSGAPTLEIL